MKRTTDEEFRLKAAQSSPNVILLSQYERLNKKVECRCRNYGVNGEYESNEQDVLLIESVCVTEKDKEAMGQRLMESLGILDSLMAS